ncbi:hypothetical protein [Flavihumibacter sp. ZG627]|uniref:hypothetical protein n=1 Tax=Flavihumibacter sp. ZG627 TaxID=1463156 RepID=UPI00057E1527|nr:hypothetical protein [Flavihumibacter sp. ZG627]KIC89850.1 hypothetical protein HY58_14365 [Flavihumibacter sp. ZG627]
MKKYLLGTIAAFLAVGFVLLQSFKTEPKNASQNLQTTYDWYPVGADNKISSTTAVYNDMLKGDVISVDACKDQVLPNCLFGTNGTVTLGQDISGQPASQRIRQQN